MSLRTGLFLFWGGVLFVLLYLYFFHYDIFNHMFHYSGPGSPYVNTPRG